MQIKNHSDVANLVGYAGFDQLALAMNVYKKARENNLLGPEMHSCDDNVSLSGELKAIRQEELKHCIQAIILFQVMMDKVPYFIAELGGGIKRKTKSNFPYSWYDTISQIKDAETRQSALTTFNSYYQNFFRTFYNPISYGRKDEEAQKINEIRVPGVYEGMRNGWLVYDILLTEALSLEKSSQHSWAAVCDECGIMDMFNLSDYPDLQDLIEQQGKTHTDDSEDVTEV